MKKKEKIGYGAAATGNVRVTEESANEQETKTPTLLLKRKLNQESA